MARKVMKNIRVNDDLWQEFKVAVIRQRRTLEWQVEWLIRRWLREQDGDKPKS